MLGEEFSKGLANENKIKKDAGAAVFIPAKDKADIFGKNHIFSTCAYCRVSTDNDEQLSSFQLQQEHYRQLARTHPNWDLKHIFAEIILQRLIQGYKKLKGTPLQGMMVFTG